MIGGRNGWIAWPAGLLCAGVVGALVWLAAPAVPATVAFAGDILRAGARTTDAAPAPARTLAPGDCRSLYPDALWASLSWQLHVVLSQRPALPDAVPAAARTSLAPQVQIGCVWQRTDSGSVQTTLSTVDAAGIAAAKAAFEAGGAACTTSGDGIRCTKESGDVVEDDIVRGGRWLSTVENGWHPDGYLTTLAARLWP